MRLGRLTAERKLAENVESRPDLCMKSAMTSKPTWTLPLEAGI
jgi:hypothetical protein